MKQAPQTARASLAGENRSILQTINKTFTEYVNITSLQNPPAPSPAARSSLIPKTSFSDFLAPTKTVANTFFGRFTNYFHSLPLDHQVLSRDNLPKYLMDRFFIAMFDLTYAVSSSRKALSSYMQRFRDFLQSSMMAYFANQCELQLPKSSQWLAVIAVDEASQTFFDWLRPPVTQKVCYIVSPEPLAMATYFINKTFKVFVEEDVIKTDIGSCLKCYLIDTGKRGFNLEVLYVIISVLFIIEVGFALYNHKLLKEIERVREGNNVTLPQQQVQQQQVQQPREQQREQPREQTIQQQSSQQTKTPQQQRAQRLTQVVPTTLDALDALDALQQQ